MNVRKRMVIAAVAAGLLVVSGAPTGRSQASPAPKCAGPVVDDFSSGAYRSPDLRSGSARATQAGSMLGENRTTFVSPGQGAGNPLEQPVVLDIGAAGQPVLVVSSGYRARHLVQFSWGLPGNRLDENLTCYDRFRIHFDGISGGGVGVIMGVVAKNTNNALAGCGQQFGQRGAFVAEFPFSCFTIPAPYASPQWSHITRVTIQTDGRGAPIPGASYAITKVEVV